MSGTLATVRVLLRDRTLQGQVAGRSSSAAGPMGTSFFAPAAGGMSSAAAAVHAAAEEGFGPGGRFFSAATAAAAAEGPFPGADHPARRQPKLGHGSGSSAEADPPPADRSLLAAMASILLARVLGLLLDLPLVHRVVARPPQLQRPADVTGTAGSNHWSDDVSLSIEGLLRLLIRDRRRLVAARRHTYAANSPHVDLSQPGAVSAFGQERLRVVAAFLMMLSRVDHPLALSEPMLEEDEDALAGGHRPRAAPCDCDFLAASKAHRCSECPAHGPSNRGTSCPSFLRDFVPCSEEQCALFLNLPMADPRSMQHLEAVRLGGLAEGLPGFPVTRGGATADSDDAGEEPGGHFPGLLHGRWRRFIARWPLGIVLLAMRLLPAIDQPCRVTLHFGLRAVRQVLAAYASVHLLCAGVLAQLTSLPSRGRSQLQSLRGKRGWLATVDRAWPGRPGPEPTGYASARASDALAGIGRLLASTLSAMMALFVAVSLDAVV
ncbi:hypothetical protein, variant 2 [Fonticula alba]|nr:hypothetical protein, variant 2 [Fonticula alba]KCV69303.1 hypothetical protein, variant 2 [Fonticula alba]|eukprot:XP_009495867.1 hypothetical protein, variant 2 [Fonticula alba]